MAHIKSLYDFVQRIDTRKVGKKVIENLIEAGCFDFTRVEQGSDIAHCRSDV